MVGYGLYPIPNVPNTVADSCVSSPVVLTPPAASPEGPSTRTGNDW